ncbi:MAG: ArsA family ATPase [Acidimicrobiia bacterium]
MTEHAGVLDRRLVYVTGKGGVGKTTIAAGLAELAARRGKRVLLIAGEANGDCAQAFQHAPVGFVPEVVAPGISTMTMNTEDSLREYLRLQLRVPIVGRIGPVAQAFDFIATAAPGVKEILTTGKICWEVRQAMRGVAPWDIVIVDSSATGHIVAQLDAPRVLDELVAVGPVREQTQWMLDILDDPTITAMVIVTTAEEMPVRETIDLLSRARARLSIAIGGVIVNRVLPELLTREDEPLFTALMEPEPKAVVTAVGGPSACGVLAAAQFAIALRRDRSQYLDALRRAVDVPISYIPELFVRSEGRRVTRQIADALDAEL